MLIGIDRDDTLSRFKEYFLNFYNKKYKTKYNLNDVFTDDPREFFNLSSLGVLREYLHFYFSTKRLVDIPPVEGSVEGINKIKKKGHELVIVSATPKLFEPFGGGVKRWANRYFGNAFSNIYLMPMFTLDSKNERKYEILQKLGIEVIIEDSLKTASICADRGMRALLLNYPWNKGEAKSVERVYSWKEISERL